jgi:hypothetical protein
MEEIDTPIQSIGVEPHRRGALENAPELSHFGIPFKKGFTQNLLWKSENSGFQVLLNPIDVVPMVILGLVRLG